MAYRIAANLLASAADVQAAAGNVDLALQDCHRINTVSAHVGWAPMLVNELVAIAIDQQASETTAKVLTFVTRKDQLDHFVPANPDSLVRGYQRTLRGEEAYSVAGFCDAVEGKDSVFAGGAAIGPGNINTIAGWFLLDEVASLQDALHRLRDIAPQPFYQTIRLRNDLLAESDPGSRRSVMTTIMLPSLLEVP